jgi:hypothetical protein
LFSKILKVIDSKSFQQELARNGLNNAKNHQIMLKIILLSIFYQLDVTYVYNEVLNNSKLRKFLGIDEVLTLKQIREIYHRYDESKYLELALKTLNKMNFKKIRRVNTIILDSTSITLDLKFGGKYLSKQKLLTKDYKRGYSTNNGHYAGFKMTLAIDQRTCKPLAILIHPGAPHDTMIFDDMLNELKKRRVLKKWQLILCDRGFQSLENYLIGINRYNVVPLLFPKKKPSLITLFERIQNPIDYYDNNNEDIGIYNNLKQKLFESLINWEEYRRMRWKIEEFFKFMKEKLKLKNIHAYTKRSVYKHVYLNVLLIGMMISTGYRKIKEITRLVDFT